MGVSVRVYVMCVCVRVQAPPHLLIAARQPLNRRHEAKTVVPSRTFPVAYRSTGHNHDANHVRTIH